MILSMSFQFQFSARFVLLVVVSFALFFCCCWEMEIESQFSAQVLLLPDLVLFSFFILFLPYNISQNK